MIKMLFSLNVPSAVTVSSCLKEYHKTFFDEILYCIRTFSPSNREISGPFTLSVTSPTGNDYRQIDKIGSNIF
jgi:hypothetical protein